MVFPLALSYILYVGDDKPNVLIEMTAWLPTDIVGVTDVFRPKTSGSMFSLEYQFQLSELQSYSSVYRFGDMTYYYMMQSHFSLINRFFSPDKQFQFNPNSGTTLLSTSQESCQTHKYGLEQV